MPFSSANLLLLVSNGLQASRITAALEPDGYALETLIGLNYPLPKLNNDPPDLAILWFSYARPEALADLENLVTQIIGLCSTQPTPVLMIIDQYGSHWVEPAFRLGVSDILTRPIHPLILRQRVRLLLQARQTKMAVARYQSSEQALLQEKERFRTVADFTYDWEYWSAPDGSLIYNSPSCERITGFAPQDFLDKPGLLSEIVIPQDRELFLNHLHNELQSPETYAIDFQILAKNGERRWIAHICQQVHSQDGRILGRRVSNRDITSRKQVENTLLRSERLAAIGRLSASLAHEINNPLQAMYNSIELLQGFELEENERGEYLEILHQEIERLMKLNREILDFSRTPRADMKPLNIIPLIEHALFLASTRLKQSRVNIKKCFTEKLPQVLASADQITQVFLNLIINAAENMPAGGNLKISTLQQADILKILFEDSGKGIPDEDMELIFDPFYSTKNEGSGLGLAVSQRIIQLHCGTITARSEPGKGSTFTVALPVLPLTP